MLSFPLYSDETYEITEAELAELETILSEQATTIETQRETLTELQTTIERQRDTLTTLSETTETQETIISALKRSFSEYEAGALRRTFRTAGVSAIIGIIAGGIAGGLIF